MIKYIMIYTTKSPKETEKLAGFLLGKIANTNLPAGGKKAIVIALEGELGAGKTVFAQGFAKALKMKAKIKSPTFTLMKRYLIPNKLKTKSYLYHLDCYRLRDHKDLAMLGIEEILNNSGNMVLIEWSDRVKKILPKNHIEIHIDHIDENVRKITVR